MFKAGLFALKMKKQAHPLFNIKKLYPVVAEHEGLPMRKNGVNEVVGNIVGLNTTSCIRCGKCVKTCQLNVFETTEGDTAKEGFGAAIRFSPKITMNVGYFWTDYKDYKKTTANYNGTGKGGTDIYSRTNKVFGAGIDYKF